jgi:hypothetical protein
VECSFIILVLPLLAIWIYFSAKGRRTTRGDPDNHEEVKEFSRETKMISFHISEADAKSEVAEDDKKMKEEFNMDEVGKANDEAMRVKLKVV